MPMDRSHYPDDWEQISRDIRFVRAEGRCEGTDSYPDCCAEHGKRHPETGSVVVLTTAHLGVAKSDGSPGDKHDKLDVRPENLAALCQRCHLDLDREDHLFSAAQTRRQKQADAGQMELPFDL